MAETNLKCRNCGETASPRANFCSSCGNKLDRRPDEAANALPMRSLERRQLTIMFCDLVNSTALAEGLDPETFSQFIEAYRACCAGPILRFDGLISQFVGDGILIYFGYPSAHEDDPDRAVRAGLEMIAAIGALEQEWRSRVNGPIAVRIGINTGMVVVGELRSQQTSEREAVFGHAVNVAARLEQLAGPNTIVISAETRRLLRGAIQCRSLGQTKVKGVATPIEVHEVLGASQAHRWHWDGGDTATDLPFVGRETELEIVNHHWKHARTGTGSAILLMGEAGVGKSRFIKSFGEVSQVAPSQWLATGTSPYARNTEYFAFAELFRHFLTPLSMGSDKSRDRDLRRILKEYHRIDPDSALGLGALLRIPIEGQDDSVAHDVQRLRKLALGAVRNWLVASAKEKPIVLVIEDLHWADASTLEAIDMVLADLAAHPILVVMSSRTDPALAHVAQITRLTLDRLRSEDAHKLLRHALGRRKLPRMAFRTLLERAAGLPLFLEELPKAIAGGGDNLADRSLDSAVPDDMTIPATLRDSLMSRLDRMGDGKRVAQIAAVLGHRFDIDLLQSLWEGSRESLQAFTAKLVDASVLMPSADPLGQNYEFKHALLEEIAYQSLLRQERRRYHRLAVRALEAEGLLTERPEVLARHYSGAGQAADAFAAWLKAGRTSAQRAAYEEALDRMNNAELALKQLVSGPDDPSRDRSWLELLTARPAVLSTLYGWADSRVETDYRELSKIADRCEELEAIFNARRGIHNLHLLRGNLRQAVSAADWVRTIAIEKRDNDRLLSWHRMSGLHEFLAANFGAAVAHMRTGISSPNSLANLGDTLVEGRRPTVVAQSIIAWSLWFLGDSEGANRIGGDARDDASKAGHPFSKANALCLAASLAQCQGQFAETRQYSEAALELSNLNEFPYWRAWSKLTNGWSLVASQEAELGLALLSDGLTEYQATGAAQMKGYALCLLGESLARMEAWGPALKSAEAALLEMRRSGIVFYTPEAWRIKGEALHAMGQRRAGLAALLRGYRLAASQQSAPLSRRLVRVIRPKLRHSSIGSSLHKRLRFAEDHLAGGHSEMVLH